MTLREWRATRAYGMAELAAIAGVTKATIIAIEHGRVTAITRGTMRTPASALGVEPMDVTEFRRALTADLAPEHGAAGCVSRLVGDGLA